MDLDYTASAQPLIRRPAFGANGAVATSQPLASGAGMQMLVRGGSAVDAAIAMAACLTVVEPTSNGIGGDAFALVWDGAKLHGLNGSGRSPGRLSTAEMERRGIARIAEQSWEAVTVPGQIRAWADLHARFGRLPFADLLEPAIGYAENGFPVSPVVARNWGLSAQRAVTRTGPEFGAWVPTFARGGAPTAGTRYRMPDHARTLRTIAQSNGADFYEGELAARSVAFSDATGGYLVADDLARHRSAWVDPISANLSGAQVWEIPPSGQGISALVALNLLDGIPGLAGLDDPQAWHHQIEAIKLAMTDAARYVADPEHGEVPVEWLLSADYATRRRALITDEAGDPRPGVQERSGTVYLCATDADGQQVSFIQSNYMGFGSGIVVPGTGIALQNRGHGFTPEPGHPNSLAPGKRPFHTIIPGFLTRDGAAVGPFGVMGGDMQPQGHVQVLLRTLLGHDDPQTALTRPRWRWVSGRTVEVEAATPPDVVDGLRRRGHDVRVQHDVGGFGRGQIIWQDVDSYVAGSDPRADGVALAW